MSPNPILRSLAFTALLEDEWFAGLPCAEGEAVTTALCVDLARDRPRDIWVYSVEWIKGWRGIQGTFSKP